MHQVSGRWQLGLLLSLITTVLWGALPIALKALLGQMDAISITWYRFTVAAGLLWAGLAWKRRLPGLRGLGPAGLTLLTLAVLGLLGNYILYLFGLDHCGPSTSQVVVQLAPLLMLLGGLALFGERFRAVQWAGLVCLVGGLLLFFNRRLAALVASLEGEAWGVLLVMLSSVAWAVYALAQKQLLTRLDSPGIMLAIYCAGAALFAPLASPGTLAALDGAGLALLLFCALNTLFAYGCFAEALAHWEASRVSAVLATTPLWTIAMMMATEAWLPGLVAPERLGGWSLLGAGLVTVGSALCALGRQEARRPVPGNERV